MNRLAKTILVLEKNFRDCPRIVRQLPLANAFQPFAFFCITVLAVVFGMGKTTSAATDPKEGLVTLLATDPKKDATSLLPGDIGNEKDEDLLKEIRQGLESADYEACRKDLKEQLQKYDDGLAALKTFITGSPAPSTAQIHAKERSLNTLRTHYLKRVRQCGPCRTRTVTSWQGKSVGYWYASDGSCLWLETNTKALSKGFEAARDSLRIRDDYVKFPHIVKLEPLTSDEKQFDTSSSSLADTFAALLAIRTPLELGSQIQAFYYHIRNAMTESTTATGDRTFMIRFRSYRQFKEPSQKGAGMIEKIEKWQLGDEATLLQQFTSPSYWVSPGGRKLRLALTKLDFVKGQWFLTEDGTFRYSTVGDFGLPLSYIKTEANEVLLEALLEMYRRTTGGLP